MFAGTIASLRGKMSGKKPKKEEKVATEEVANEEDEASQKGKVSSKTMRYHNQLVTANLVNIAWLRLFPN